MSPLRFVVRFFAVASIACSLGGATAHAQRTHLSFVDGLDQSASHAGPGFVKSIEIFQRYQSESMVPDAGSRAVERSLLLNQSGFSSHTSTVLQIPHAMNVTGAQEIGEPSKSSTDREISKHCGVQIPPCTCLIPTAPAVSTGKVLL
jgi:hypothetical protein